MIGTKRFRKTDTTDDMTHSFELRIGKESSVLVLLCDGAEVIVREWPETRDMGQRLFSAIDSILEETGLAPESIGSFDVVTDIPDSFTSVKIGMSVANAWTFGSEAMRKG
jgi:tRNA A37 threonylcarbamoyladenosine modification protein TsaB